ncbi:MAG: SDR family NAD(P)-dependent oxidoreductase [Adhaeribacter sp.]
MLYLLADTGGIAAHLEKMLIAAGANARIVADLPEEARYVVSLQGLDVLPAGDPEKAAQHALHLNFGAFALAQALGSRLSREAGYLVLAFDNGLGGALPNERPWSGGISALAKTASLEWPRAQVQSICLACAGKEPETIARELFQALTAGGRVTEMEIDPQGESHQWLASPAALEDQTRPLQDGDTILVSGGAKGATAACLLALAERKKLNIGILGRTQLTEEPAYAVGCSTDAELKNAVFQQARKESRQVTPLEVNKLVSDILGNREVTENLRQLRQLGSRVSYLPVDITDRGQVIAAVESLRSEFGSVQGLVHAAGVLADKFIHEKTTAQFSKVFNTKIQGFRNLLEATASDALTHICCFSSVAARMGNRGQVDYAMANEVLNKVCQAEQKKRGQACVVKSLNWGPWDGGMVSPQLKGHFAAMGVDLIPLETGAAMFADEMEDKSTAQVEIVIGGAFDKWGGKTGKEEEKSHTMWVQQANNPFLDSHRIQGKVIVPMMMANEWCMRLAQSLCPDLQVVEAGKMKVYKGIQLPHFDQQGDLLRFIYTLDRKPEAATVEVKIQNEAGTLLYGVSVQMAPERQNFPGGGQKLSHLETWALAETQIYPARLFHGPDFQVIDKLEGISGEACTGSLKISGSPDKGRQDWQSDMFLFDGGIQLAILAMDTWTGNNSSLPLGYDSLQLYGPAGLATHLHCELNLKKRGRQDSEWDLLFKDKNQQVRAEMTGLRLYMYQPN